MRGYYGGGRQRRGFLMNVAWRASCVGRESAESSLVFFCGDFTNIN